MLIFILLLIGFVVLVRGADLLVDGAASLARQFGISTLVIGLTIVAFGTSAPELVVNVLASASGANDIAVGNVVGSNIVNIFLILGVSALIYPLRVTHTTVWKEIPFALLAMLVVFVKANDALLGGESMSTLNRADGLVLLAFFVIFMYYTFGIARSSSTDGIDAITSDLSLSRSLLYIVLGTIALVVGGRMIVNSAVALAMAAGVSQALIGLTVLAVGTSLPELATGIAASRKKQTDIAVGNVVGSNIFNIFMILGVSSVVRPIIFDPMLNFDIVVATIATVLIFVSMFIGRRHVLQRWQGGMFVALYLVYTVYLVMRG
jgi:cation:H+ antiporter